MRLPSKRVLLSLLFFITISVLLLKQWGLLSPVAATKLLTKSTVSRLCQPPQCDLTSTVSVSDSDRLPPTAVVGVKVAPVPGTIEIAVIFRHANSKGSLQSNFHGAVESLLQHTSVPIRLHIVTDAQGYRIATDIIQQVQASDDSMRNKILQVELVSTAGVEVLSAGKESAMVGVLQEFFTSRRDSYYRDPLFFFSLFLHNILPDLTRVILLDIDIKVEGDIADLHAHFSRFQSHHVMAMSQELSPAYRHDLSFFRKSHPTTTLGSPPSEGGFPGYNSGVMLIDIPRLKSSTIIGSYLERGVLVERCKHYSFQGTLGDQDLYTLIAFDHPQLFYTLPCTWNRQLCQWYRDKGYALVFDDYFKCPGKVQLYHGNCKSVIPRHGS